MEPYKLPPELAYSRYGTVEQQYSGYGTGSVPLDMVLERCYYN